MRRYMLVLGFCTLAALVGCRVNLPESPPPPAAEPAPEPRPQQQPVEWSADMQTIADGNNRFALELYGKLAADEKEKGKNVFYSPYSVHTALGMTTTGAKGKTRDEMVKVLNLPADEVKVLASGDLGRFYNAPRKEYQLSVANALWGQKGWPWRADWLGAQNDRFGAGFREADFKSNPDGERDRINKWVENQTQERIKELLLQGQITRDTTMVLTNAIYFKGSWAKRFDPKRTANAPFMCDDNTKVDVPMMHASLRCGYAHVDGAVMAELPYKGGELSMVVVLPSRKDDLAALEKALTPELVAKWFAALKDRPDIQVSLPKFRIEARYELPKHLKALGMIEAFDRERADFTGMASKPPGFIQEVAHKAFVEVNEEGTEAAAATAVAVGVLSGPPSFYANCPFLFFIRDTKHGTILFMGRVVKP